MKSIIHIQTPLGIFLTFSSFVISSSEGIHGVENLKPMHVLRDHLTLSGFSSGGGFAQMVQFAYSSKVQGVAVFSHTFYRCGFPNGDFVDWDHLCTLQYNTSASNWYDPERVHLDLDNYYSKGLIENPLNLRNKRLYVYTGLRNSIFHPVQSMNILKVYERYIRNPNKVKTRIQDSVFVMPTDNNFGLGCKNEASNHLYIGNCGFSGAFEALSFLLCDHFKLHHPRYYASLMKFKAHQDHEWDNSVVGRGWRPVPVWSNALQLLKLQPLRAFDQTVFLHGLALPQMDDVGFFYVPQRCKKHSRPCLVHVFFHGCGTNRNVSGSKFIENSGFLEVAEANDIVMLFPQNHEKSLVATTARGCWDTFGYSGPMYATQKGDQITAVWRMITHLISGASHSLPGRPIPNF